MTELTEVPARPRRGGGRAARVALRAAPLAEDIRPVRSVVYEIENAHPALEHGLKLLRLELNEVPGATLVPLGEEDDLLDRAASGGQVSVCEGVAKMLHERSKALAISERP